MEKKLLVVCDLENEYTRQLSNYLSLKKNMPFEIHAYTDVALLAAFARERSIDVLLLSEEACYELKRLEGDIRAREVFILSEDGVREADENSGLYQGCKTIYKYQNTENILREVMCTYADAEKPVSGCYKGLADTRMIAVYSPVRRSLKTSFAMTLGQVLGEKRRTLYINLEEYSGFNRLLKTTYMTDMSDLLYYISQRKPNFIWKMASIVQTMGSLDYIPPAISPPDIRAIKAQQWMEFFAELDKCGYDNVILDLGETVNGLYDILRLCVRIYTPVRDDAVSYAKLEQYEALMKSMGYEDVLEKSRKLSFSYFKGMEKGLDMLVYSELGAYVRELLRHEDALMLS